MDKKKRIIPKLKPVIFKGVLYEKEPNPLSFGFNQSNAILRAINVFDGEIVWRKQIYQTNFEANEEIDNQEVHIISLELDLGKEKLIACDELNRIWSIQLDSGETKQII